MLKAVLFDLDGVITDTAKFHFLAWKEMAAELEIEIDEKFNETLKGIDRRSSIEKILKKGNIILKEQEILNLMDKKNKIYINMLDGLNSNDLLIGMIDLFKELKKNSIKISIASASKNAPYIIKKLQVEDYIDYIADPSKCIASKPDPSIFLLAAKGVDVSVDECIGIEDSLSGINALKKANIKSIGIGVSGDVSVTCTQEITYKLIKELYEK